MIKVTSTEIQSKLGQYLDAAQTEDITITKQGREFAYVLSAKAYKRMKELEDAIEDAWLSQLAKEAIENDEKLSPEESKAFYQRMKQDAENYYKKESRKVL